MVSCCELYKMWKGLYKKVTSTKGGRMKPSNTIVVSSKYIEEKERQIADLSKTIKRLRKQLKEANEAIKFYAETTVGHKQKDGTYGMWICSGEVAWENPLDRIKSRIDYICYDPRPAKKWLKKWGAK